MLQFIVLILVALFLIIGFFLGFTVALGVASRSASQFLANPRDRKRLARPYDWAQKITHAVAPKLHARLSGLARLSAYDREATEERVQHSNG